MLVVYGVVSALAAIAALLLIRERPPTPPARDEYVHTRFFEGFRHIFGRRDMVLTLVLFFIGLGIFNAVSSMVDSIAGSLGVADSNGVIGVVMIVGGVVGAIILPILSDRFRKRRFFLVLCMAGLVPAMGGLAFADALFSDPSRVYMTALVSAFVMGFFVMSAGPIGFQYAAEVSYPAPEASSQGLLLLSGQISGIVFVALMSLGDNRLLEPMMALFVLLSVLAFGLVVLLRESPMIVTEEDRR
jgi:Na+/melibiose symporter-like transporter